METKILKVVSCGPVAQIPSTKAEGGTIAKRSMILQELGGKYENEYIATQFGNSTALPLIPGDVVAVALRTITREYNGQFYQDTLVDEIIKLQH